MNDFHRLLFCSCAKSSCSGWHPPTARLSGSPRSCSCSFQQRPFFFFYPNLKATVHVRKASHFRQYWPAIYRTRLFGASLILNASFKVVFGCVLALRWSQFVCTFVMNMHCVILWVHTRRPKIIHCGFVKPLLWGSFKPEQLMLKDQIQCLLMSFDLLIARKQT